MLHGLLLCSITLLDAIKQTGPTSVFINSLLALGITINHLIVRYPVVSVSKAILAKIKALGTTLAVAGQTCSAQIGVTDIHTAVHGLQEILGASKRALEVTLSSASDLCISTLDRFHHLGVLRSPVAWLYLLFIVYSQLKLAYDFARFISSVVGAAFRKARNQATSESLGRYIDAGTETEDEDIFGGKEWDDSLVTPRSSRRNKKATSWGERVARKSLREVLSEF